MMDLFKKVTLLVLTLLMVCCLVACDGGGQEETKPTLNPGDANCDHTWSPWKVTKEQSCSKDGHQKRQCETCGKEEQETLLAWGHIYSGANCVAVLCYSLIRIYALAFAQIFRTLH